MAKLERKNEILTPKVDATGSQSIKRETVEVEKVEEVVDPAKEAQQKKSRLRGIIIFGIIDLLLFGYIVYQIVMIFKDIVQAAANK